MMKDFGVNVEDIEVHSLQKGAVSYVASGSTCLSPQVTTNIRAGWLMGIMQGSRRSVCRESCFGLSTDIACVVSLLLQFCIIRTF